MPRRALPLALALVAASAFVVLPAQGQTGSPCVRPDEWESPPRILPGQCSFELSGGLGDEFAFWGYDGEDITVSADPDATDIELCLHSPTGHFSTCRDSGGMGAPESIFTQFGSQGWWTIRVSSMWGADRVVLSLNKAGTPAQSDCGGGDAGDAFSIAKALSLPQTRCDAELVWGDPADFYRVAGEEGGRLTLSAHPATATVDLCALAPRGFNAGWCARVGSAGGGYTVTLDETGVWRISVESVPGGGFGDYELSASMVPPNHAPTVTSVRCTPEPGGRGQPVTCDMSALDVDGNNVFYLVDWGDGSPPERVPASGHAAPGASRSATHTYADPGTNRINVTATDDGDPPKTSPLFSILHETLHARPTITGVACAPAPARPGDVVRCDFVATDDSTGVAYVVSWGDGTPSVRVPAEGHVAPGEVQSATHAYGAKGDFTFRVTPTDDGAPPQTGSTATFLVRVDAKAPTMGGLTCPSRAAANATITCRILASDADSTQLYYTIDWGDGTIERVPSTGYATAGVALDVPHAYARTGYRTVRANATDDSPIPQTSGTLARDVVTGSLQTVTGSNAAGAGLDLNARLGPGAPPVDGTWIALAAPGRGDETTPARLTVISGELLRDLQVWFYDASGARVDGGECAADGGSAQACHAPLGATRALVRSDLFHARNAWRFEYVH